MADTANAKSTEIFEDVMKKNMKLVAIDAEDIAVLRTNIRAVTADGVRDALGISWDTWNKVAKGHPVSMRTRDRLSKALEGTTSIQRSANDDLVD